MEIQDVVTAARAKFGDVMKVVRKRQGYYFVACRRHQAPLPERPYMTITAGIDRDSGQVGFYWGHYDLTVEQVYAAICDAETRAG